jgi:hypothetical protein
LRIDQFAVDLDVIFGGIRLGAQFGDNLAVYRNSTGDNQLFSVPARSNSGCRNKFL